jgi:hypothetical protein
MKMVGTSCVLMSTFFDNVEPYSSFQPCLLFLGGVKSMHIAVMKIL